jgi:hypothetical protein
MLLFALSCLLGYLASEWPRLLWPGNKQQIVSRARIGDPVDRRLSLLLPILGFVAIIPAMMFAMSLVSPGTAHSLGLGLVALVVFCVMGMALGLLELISGLSPVSDWMHDVASAPGAWGPA